MGSIRSFRDLIVWQKGMEGAMRIFQLTKARPASERYLLADQIVRSSRSVPSQIAEAWRRRRYPAAWISKLNEAEGEAAETQTHLDVALRCAYVEQSIHKELDGVYEEILSMLVTMIDNPDQWRIR